MQRPYVRSQGRDPVQRPARAGDTDACTAPNRTHGPPLAFGSCNPPQPGSTHLTIGVGDGSPAFRARIGFVRMDVVVGVPGPPDDSDVDIRFSLTNVMRASDLSEYTGELRAELTVRRTDRDGRARPRLDVDGLPVRLHGALHAHAGLEPRRIDLRTPHERQRDRPRRDQGQHRAIWALDKLRVYDGGPDEDADTEADNSLFMTQGVFVP